jgi:acetyltransferase-like isoleucine patch superfamily enzyme
MPVERVSSSTQLHLASEPQGRVIIDGVNCRLRVGQNVVLTANILISPEVVNATVDIGDGCNLAGVIRIVRGKGGTVRIGARTSFNHAAVSMHETANVTIGADCMFSTDVHMDPSDMHPIYDRATGERLNPPQDIVIGDHVWLGTKVLVMKGASIGSGSIVGAGSLVSGELPENVLAVGAPARIVRENVVWTRDMDEQPRLVPGSGPATKRKRGWFR